MLTKRLQIPAPAGELELLTQFPEHEINTIMIICHPHPLFGGSMQNKVVTTLAKVCEELAIASIRFNFRGVGKSTGVHDEGVGEIEDLKTVIAWALSIYPKAHIWLAGFSFGAYISAAVAATGVGEQLISIAPPTMRWGFQKLTDMPCPWLVVQGDKDEVVEAEEVFSWFAAHHPQATVIRMNDASHFFHGRLLELRELVFNYLKNR